MNNQQHWTAGLHHDGSALYVSDPLPKSGQTVTVWLRAPLDAPIHIVILRTAPDGEHHFEPMQIARTDAMSAWWSGSLEVTMPIVHYRFKVITEEGGYWLTAFGVSRADSPDWFDFKLVADFAAPTWTQDAVFYQIFPDRFFNGDPANSLSPGQWEKQGLKTQIREWGAPPLPYSQTGNLDFYGGDLPGIIQKLPYLQDLGVNALYLNPIFVAYSNHRYDVADYHQVDPYLGGASALADLRQALDHAGMRLVLDITPNHCGARHPWFSAAQADFNAPTAEYFTFYNHPHEYATWLGHKSLVKLNYRSQKLRDAMYRAPDSAMRYWLRPPYRIDGWRLDVANMTARQGMTQLASEVKREMRAALKADNPDLYLFGENFYDGTPHLQGDQLDATMNYQGFTIPLWGWLPGTTHTMPEAFMDSKPLPAEALAEQWRRFRAGVPWVVARQQFNQLGSHDTPRILTLLHQNKALLKAAVALLMTFPGVPCVYYGDEIGMEGAADPDNRRCMRWDEQTWDHDLREYYKKLIALRRAGPALKHGGFQQLYAHDGLLVYQRHAKEQRLVIAVYRGSEPLPDVVIPVWHAGLADHARLTDLLSGTTFIVEQGALRFDILPAATALILQEGE